MPTLPTQSFQTIVQKTVVGIQGRASKLVNFAIGSTLRAVAEGFASVFLWFQALVLQLLLAIRLSTSTGTDVDTFTADFMPVLPGSQTAALPGGSPRLGAQKASGQVTFARLTAGPTSCFIPVGATVQTADASQSFQVTADATYPTYSAAAGGYTLQAGIASITVPIEALVAGSAGNVIAGAITVITSSVTGIDTVVNNAALLNGADVESDASLKKRFADYILGLARGDLYGTNAAIEGTAITVQYTITENYNLDGTWHPGFYCIVVDDGSGNPSATFMTTVTNAVVSVRPLGIQAGVFEPTILNATVSMQITTAAGYDHNTVVSQVSATVQNNINSLGLGNNLPYTLLTSWAYSVAGVTSVQDVLLNGASGDAATMNAYIVTADNNAKIYKYTIKCQSCIVS